MPLDYRPIALATNMGPSAEKTVLLTVSLCLTVLINSKFALCAGESSSNGGIGQYIYRLYVFRHLVVPTGHM